MAILDQYRRVIHLEIERTFHLFHGLARHAMGIDHHSSDISVTQERLDRANVVVRLQQMRCKAVA